MIGSALTCFYPGEWSGSQTDPGSPDLWGHSQGRNQSPEWWAGSPPVSGSAEPCCLWASRPASAQGRKQWQRNKDSCTVLMTFPSKLENNHTHYCVLHLSVKTDLMWCGFLPVQVPTMLMRLCPRARTSSWGRFIRAPACKARLLSRLWSSSKVWRRGSALKDWTVSSEIRLWLRTERQRHAGMWFIPFTSHTHSVKHFISLSQWE